jgi:hypothetical protein
LHDLKDCKTKIYIMISKIWERKSYRFFKNEQRHFNELQPKFPCHSCREGILLKGTRGKLHKDGIFFFLWGFWWLHRCIYRSNLVRCIFQIYSANCTSIIPTSFKKY